MFARQHLQRGLDALHRGELVDAEKCFGLAIEHCPDDAKARCQLADVLWQRDAKEAALEQMNNALRCTDGQSVDLTIRVGRMNLETGKNAEAYACAVRATRVGADTPDAWRLLGDVLVRQDEHQQALAAYYRTLSLSPSDVRSQLAVAELHQTLERPQRALATLERLAHQFAPGGEPADLLVQKGRALRELGRQQEAVDVLLAAVNRQNQPDPQLMRMLEESQIALRNSQPERFAMSKETNREDRQEIAAAHTSSSSLR